jgi:hypothetical protein
MYTFLDQPIMSQGGAGMPSSAQPKTQNTNDDGPKGDVAARLEAMQKQRESEFAGVARK